MSFNQKLAKSGLQTKSSLLSIFENKALQEHSNAHLFMLRLSFVTTVATLSSRDRDHVARSD